MSEKIKITMLGTSNTGKTCFLVAMYKMMILGKKLKGFTLSIKDQEQNHEFRTLWKRMNDPKGRRWPPSTGTEPLTYDFQLNYAYKPIIGFDWYDYRGGALIDAPGSDDVYLLRKRFLETSCIFLCLSGEHFVTKPNFNIIDDIGAAEINLLITDLQSHSKKNIPPAVVIVITKFDLCRHRGLNDIIKEIKEIFEVLFSEGPKWLVMICPVTLGYNLNDKTKELDPHNVHVPIMFTLYAELLKQKRIFLKDLTTRNFQLEDLSANIFSQWFNSKVISDKESDVRFFKENINIIQNKISLLSEKLLTTRGINLYFDGKRTNIYDFLM